MTWQLDLLHHVTYIFCCHAAFYIRESHGNWSWFNMATVVVVTWQLQCNTHGNWICCTMSPVFLFPCCIFHSASTWQLELTQHGNCSCCHMATTVHYTWQLDLPPHRNSLLLYLHFTSCTLSFHIPFFCFPGILTHFFDPCRHPWGDFTVTWWSLP